MGWVNSFMFAYHVLAIIIIALILMQAIALVSLLGNYVEQPLRMKRFHLVLLITGILWLALRIVKYILFEGPSFKYFVLIDTFFVIFMVYLIIMVNLEILKVFSVLSSWLTFKSLTACQLLSTLSLLVALVPFIQPEAMLDETVNLLWARLTASVYISWAFYYLIYSSAHHVTVYYYLRKLQIHQAENKTEKPVFLIASMKLLSVLGFWLQLSSIIIFILGRMNKDGTGLFYTELATTGLALQVVVNTGFNMMIKQLRFPDDFWNTGFPKTLNESVSPLAFVEPIHSPAPEKPSLTRAHASVRVSSILDFYSRDSQLFAPYLPNKRG